MNKSILKNTQQCMHIVSPLCFSKYANQANSTWTITQTVQRIQRTRKEHRGDTKLYRPLDNLRALSIGRLLYVLIGKLLG